MPYVQGALLAMDVSTGGILAMVGGRDFKDSPFNRATQAVRQPGSGFKPFVYTAAIDNGFTPADIILDAPIVVPEAGPPEIIEDTDPPLELPTDWIPTNYSEDFQGNVRLRYALKRSINIPAVKLGMMVGPREVARYARSMGIGGRLSRVYSLALGSSEVRLIDMVTAYTVLANQGILIEPHSVERIEDRSGKLLERHNGDSREVLSAQTAYIVTNMLESVLDSGTGWAARDLRFEHPAAGKTGTTNDCTDAWFIGFSPRIVCGTWVGFDDRRSLGKKMTGARVALPIWTEFMKRAHRDAPKEAFRVPPGIVVKKICSESGELATHSCPHVLEEVFIQGTEPREPCGTHWTGSTRRSPRRT
jgi:penicillin-binding protein 1A